MAILPFNIDKAVQAVAFVLKSSGCRMDCIRALKLLYMAERIELRETGHELIGERFVAMKNGPLHSYLYDLCKLNGREKDQRRWDEFLHMEGYRLVAKDDPGISRLSDYETQLLSSVVDRHADIDTWTLVEMTHQFPEWKKCYPDPGENTSRAIELSDLIEDPQQLASMLNELDEQSELAEILR